MRQRAAAHRFRLHSAVFSFFFLSRFLSGPGAEIKKIKVKKKLDPLPPQPASLMSLMGDDDGEEG